MSKTMIYIKREVRAALFCFALPAIIGLIMSVQPAFGAEEQAIPDFAFPKTVVSSSSRMLDEALRNHRPVEALKGAMQWEIATLLTDGDSINRARNCFSMLSDSLPGVYGRVASMLEAKLCSEYYTANQWTISRRPDSGLLETKDIRGWNTPDFEKAVREMVDKALSEPGDSLCPLSLISPILADADDAIREGISVRTFLVLQAAEALTPFAESTSRTNVIPFAPQQETINQSTGDLITSILGEEFQVLKKQGKLFMASLIADKLADMDIPKESEYGLFTLYETFRQTPYCARLTSLYANTRYPGQDNAARSLRLALYSDYLKKFPDAPGADKLRRDIAALTRSDVSFLFPDHAQPGVAVDVRLRSSNLYNCWCLIYKLPDGSRANPVRYGDLDALTPVKSLHLAFQGEKPELLDTVFNIGAMPPGLYALIPSASRDKSGILEKNKRAHVETMHVSSLSAFVSASPAGRSLFVVSAANNEPVGGAKVTIYPIVRGKRGTPVQRVTDANGAVTLPAGDWEYRVSYYGNMAYGTVWKDYSSVQPEKETLQASVFIDRPVCHPGDSISFAAVAFTKRERILKAAPHRKFEALLMDSEWKPLDTLSLLTDKDGRLDGVFAIPVDLRLGTFSVAISENNRHLGSGSVEVADYKIPTFEVELSRDSISAPGCISFTGKVAAYAGYPISDIPVKISVTAIPDWWRRRDQRGEYTTNCVTNAEGQFTLQLDTAALAGTPYADARFRIVASATDRTGETQESRGVCFSVGRNYPEKDPAHEEKSAKDRILWIKNTEIEIDPRAGEIPVEADSSYPGSYVLAQVSDSRHLVETRWLKVASDGKVRFSVAPPDDLERLFVRLTACRDFEFVEKMITIVPRVQTEPLEIETVSFRDHISPGSLEKWTFKLKWSEQAQDRLPVIAVLSDKALNAFAPFDWKFNPSSSLWWYPYARVEYLHHGHSVNSYSFPAKNIKEEKGFVWPQWQTYGYFLYPSAYRSGYLKFSRTAGMQVLECRKESMICAGQTNDMDGAVMAEGAAEIATPIERNDAGEIERNDAEERLPLRMAEYPVAFFKPSLLTDSDGVVEIAFTAPAFAGTWQLQVLGYRPEDMKGAVKILDAVSSRKVVAKLHGPAFLRTGDKALLTATITNNSGASSLVRGRIEFVASDGRVLVSSTTEPAMLDAYASKIIELSVSVPDLPGVYTIRTYAESGSCTDGEQIPVRVLQASAPIRESNPFWFSGGSGEVSVDVPDCPADASLELTYSSNPLRDCLASLPAPAYTDSPDLLRHADALYTALLTSWIKRAHPDGYAFREGPAVSSMDSLARVELEYLKGKQSKSGGWGWCPGMRASRFVTTRVLTRMAQLSGLGLLPAEARSLVNDACLFVEAEWVKEWEGNNGKIPMVSEMLPYLYAAGTLGRNFKGKFAELERKVEIKLADNWRKLGVMDKATYAIFLARGGNRTLPLTLLSSVAEHAAKNKERGMWFPNLSDPYSPYSPLTAASRVLEAYRLIDPEAPETDLLRQGLLISRQTLSWNDPGQAVDLVTAILASGTDWTAEQPLPVVKANGEVLKWLPSEGKSGSFSIVLPAGTRSVSLSHNGECPAWGAVTASWTLPITDVKPYGSPQVSVTKRIVPEELKAGATARVALCVTTDRDMEFVELTDNRAACLVPATQLSGYVESDGLWLYREVRYDKTKFYVPYLPKGVHVLNYDVKVEHAGLYSLGIAEMECTLAPVLRAHSGGCEISVQE